MNWWTSVRTPKGLSQCRNGLPLPAFLRDARNKTGTLREQFRAEMGALVSWTRLLALIAPHFPRVGSKGGRPPMPIETMLRVYFLQQWYALSDPMAEEMR